MPARTRSFRFRIVVLLGSLLVALALGEAGVRVLGVDAPRPDLGVIPHPRWHHWHRTNHQLSFRVQGECYDVPVHFNALGMRDSHGIDLKKRPGTLRVAVVGDSFVEAMQVREAEGIVRRLEEHLSASGRPVEVLNFGCSGFSTTLESVLVRDWVMSFSPDVVVCLHHFSDISEDWSFSKHAIFDGPELIAVPATVNETERAIAQTFERSQLYRVARSGVRRPLPTTAVSYKQSFDAVVHDPYTADDEEAWRYSLAALGRMGEELRRREIRFLVALVPISTQVEPVDADYAARLGFRYLAEGKRLEHRGYQSKVAGYCAEQGIRCLDLLEPFRAANPEGKPHFYLPRDLHWTPAGHDLGARQIAEVLQTSPR